MGQVETKDFADSGSRQDDKSKESPKDASNPPRPAHGYFALAKPENKDELAAQTPSGMPLFVAPDFGKDGTGDELDDAPSLPHEQAPYHDDYSLSPTTTRS